MLLVSHKIGTLPAFFRSLPFGGSLCGVLLWALAIAWTMAFFFAKPLQLAGISVASGIATWRSGKEITFKKFAAINWAIFSNPEGFKWSRNSDSMRLGGVYFLFLKRPKSRKDLLVFNSVHNLLKEGIPLSMAKIWALYS